MKADLASTKNRLKFPLHTKTIFIIIIKLCFISAAIYWVLSKLNLKAFCKVIETPDFKLLFLAYLMLHISLFFSALRSRYYFSTFGIIFNRTFSLSLYYIGSFFNIILPGGVGGDGYKVYLIWKLQKFSKLTSLRIMLYERVNGVYILIFLALILLCFSSFYLLIPYGKHLIAIAIITLTPSYLLCTKYILRDKTKTMLFASIYSFFVQFFQVMFSLCLVKAIALDASFITYIDLSFLFLTASVLSIIPISIGGIGLRELTFFYGAKLLGNNPELGVAFAVLSFVLYVLVALPGLPLYFFIHRIKATRTRVSHVLS